MLAMRLRVAADRSDVMCEYLTADAFPRAMRITGVVACHLYAADERASYVATAESSTRAFDVPSWVVLCEATFAPAAEKARDVLTGSELDQLGVEVRSDAAVYALEICRLARYRNGTE